jgi:hypothetical protein
MTNEPERPSGDFEDQLERLRRRLARIEFFAVATFLVVLAQCAPYLSASLGEGVLAAIGGVVLVVVGSYVFSILMADVDQSPNRRNENK